jgi:hypothetical protein
MIINDPSSPRVQAMFLKAHLKLVALGMQPRGRKGDLLKKASAITGKVYRRGEYAKAAKDLESV